MRQAYSWVWSQLTDVTSVVKHLQCRVQGIALDSQGSHVSQYPGTYECSRDLCHTTFKSCSLLPHSVWIILHKLAGVYSP